MEAAHQQITLAITPPPPPPASFNRLPSYTNHRANPAGALLEAQFLPTVLSVICCVLTLVCILSPIIIYAAGELGLLSVTIMAGGIRGIRASVSYVTLAQIGADSTLASLAATFTNARNGGAAAVAFYVLVLIFWFIAIFEFFARCCNGSTALAPSGAHNPALFGCYARLAALIFCVVGTSAGLGSITALTNNADVVFFLASLNRVDPVFSGEPSYTFGAGAGCGIAATILSLVAVILDCCCSCCCISPQASLPPPTAVTTLNAAREREVKAAAMGAALPPPTAPPPPQPAPALTTAQLPMGPCPYWKLVTNGAVTCEFFCFCFLFFSCGRLQCMRAATNSHAPHAVYENVATGETMWQLPEGGIVAQP